MANETANILLFFACLLKVGLSTLLIFTVPAVLVWERLAGKAVRRG